MTELDQQIELQTTPGHDIPGHLATNARCRACDKMVLRLPVKDQYTLEPGSFPETCKCEVPEQLPVFGQPNEYAGKTLVICGAGPSIRQAYKECRKADHVWGCNRAASWLARKGWHITHALAIDAGTSMLETVWREPPDVRDFILASSVHPALIEHLLARGKRLRLFHSMRGGVDEELNLYRMLFPPAPLVGMGLNSVNRALELAEWLGYRRIALAGADNAFGPNDEMYGTGEKVIFGDATVRGVIDGREWHTRPDMLASAKSLARVKWRLGERLQFIGNTLPRALSRKDEAFLDRVIRYSWELDEDEHT